jgi:hypothetical protein
MRRGLVAAAALLVTFAAGCAAKPVLDQIHPLYINTGERTGGTIGNSVPLNNPAPYEPVDQNAPLDYSTQPASVPHTYVGGRLYNVQVLKQYDYPGLLGQMAYFSQSLGVNCQYCHATANYAYDTPMKKIARTMIVMVSRIQSEHIADVHKQFPSYVVSGAVGCATCHRGAPLMPVKYNVVPVGYLDWPAKSSRQAGFVVNSMYSAARSLGVNCLFCHNSADFVSLQYYPTNQIAHRMWRMLDDINHKYLPANIEAVTCYTCHQGNKWPNQLVAGGTDETPVQVKPVHPEVHVNPGTNLASGAQP